MTFYIHSSRDVVVKKEGEIFLVIKRRGVFGVKCRFFKDGQLVLESYLFGFLLPFVTIQYQNLPKKIWLRRKRWFYYSLLYDDVELSLKSRLFRNPSYLFFKNGVQYGSLTDPKETFGRKAIYKFETDIDDDEVNLLFIVLLHIHIGDF